MKIHNEYRQSVRRLSKDPARYVDGLDQTGGNGDRSGPTSEIFRRETQLNLGKN